jgi:glycosyltransferase involved in cell wall biosynthesis
MKIALIVTTYNNPPMLEMNLKSILKQTQMPDEILIADDGFKNRN